MKTLSSLWITIVAFILCPFTRAHCADAPVPAASPQAVYPLTTCPVSGEELGSMGKPVEYVYKQPGKPDRIVFLCCRGCIKPFTKTPSVYLKKLDEAEAATAKQAVRATPAEDQPAA